MAFQGWQQAYGRSCNQASTDGAKTSHGADGQVVTGHVGNQRGQHQHHNGWKCQHACQRRQGTSPAKKSPAQHHGQVHHVGSRHNLGDRPVVYKRLRRNPLFAINQFALNDGHHTAKAL